jgi:hypothetical protein
MTIRTNEHPEQAPPTETWQIEMQEATITIPQRKGAFKSEDQKIDWILKSLLKTLAMAGMAEVLVEGAWESVGMGDEKALLSETESPQKNKSH